MGQNCIIVVHGKDDFKKSVTYNLLRTKWMVPSHLRNSSLLEDFIG